MANKFDAFNLSTRAAAAAMTDFRIALENAAQRVIELIEAHRNDKLGQVACRTSHMTLGIVHGNPCPHCRAQL